MNSGKLVAVLQLLGIGWYIAICIGGGAIGGLLLDRWLDVAPFPLTLILSPRWEELS